MKHRFLSRGLLTHAILAGTKGAKLKDGGFVDVVPLFQYALDEVPKLARGIGYNQTPQLASPRGDSFSIGQLSKEDQDRVPLAGMREVLVRVNLREEKLYHDRRLELSQRVNARLRFEGSRRRGGLAFVDVDEFPNA